MQNDLISRSALIAEHCDGCAAIAHGLCDHDVCGAAQLILEDHAVDAVPRPVFEQIQWERDCAMQQLKDHDIPFGGIAPAVDAVSVVRSWCKCGGVLVFCDKLCGDCPRANWTATNRTEG